MPATVYEFKSHLAYQWLVNRKRKHFELRVFPLFCLWGKVRILAEEKYGRSGAIGADDRLFE